MGITEAIARVRASAKKAGLESALASLGASLKSSAIPAPLRPAATRIASLIGAQRTEPRDVASLERALEHAHAGPHGPAEVCPFTGLRADGSVSEAHSIGAAPAAVAGPAALESMQHTATAEVSGIQPVLKIAPLEETRVEVAPVAKPVQAPSASPEPAAAEAEQPPVKAAPAPAQAAEQSPVVQATAASVAPPASVEGDEQRAQKAQANGKEKLAGDRSPAKTTARSANKSAAKQTNGRAPGNRKKS